MSEFSKKTCTVLLFIKTRTATYLESKKCHKRKKETLELKVFSSIIIISIEEKIIRIWRFTVHQKLLVRD